MRFGAHETVWPLHRKGPTRRSLALPFSIIDDSDKICSGSKHQFLLLRQRRMWGFGFESPPKIKHKAKALNRSAHLNEPSIQTVIDFRLKNGFISLFMAKRFSPRRVSSADLRKRKLALLARLRVPSHAVRGSSVRQFLTCGKSTCRCRRGQKHGPFHYIVQCLGVGNINKFLLKNLEQQRQARSSIEAYVAFQKQLEQLSKINTELLRRAELFDDHGEPGE